VSYLRVTNVPAATLSQRFDRQRSVLAQLSGLLV
jgi:hypothetical protein